MIGWYVHHHGRGHATRGVQIARRLSRPVVGFGSMPRPDGWPGEWVELPPDVTPAPVDPTAGGVFHWAPLGHQGHRERLGLIAEHLRGSLSTMVVDVSAEVTLLARLFGVRTAVLAMRGNRRDRPHEAAYDAASILIAPWPESAPEPTWPQRWLRKTRHVGAISRFDDRPAQQAPTGRRVLVLWGAGGTEATREDLRAAVEATPGWEWRLRTPEGAPSPDVWADLAWADVVVTHGGQNAVAEVAAAGRPAVVIAQRRPFDEQQATVAALRALRCCVALDDWPAAGDWPGLLAHAATSTAWERWTFRDGAARAAAAIDHLVQEAH
ncbi:glycosyltransferase [Tessaracoccus massiliensis]|uniref:glycosyltransferase n=1 Tax=Tessaracoccus massiliensis TaxID=1522311 RepID=UPI00058FB630|nr:glycosyltransferase [Tessaracoccus massiliensis]